jgi:hypothetical protein
MGVECRSPVEGLPRPGFGVICTTSDHPPVRVIEIVELRVHVKETGAVADPSRNAFVYEPVPDRLFPSGARLSTKLPLTST